MSFKGISLDISIRYAIPHHNGSILQYCRQQNLQPRYLLEHRPYFIFKKRWYSATYLAFLPVACVNWLLIFLNRWKSAYENSSVLQTLFSSQDNQKEMYIKKEY